MAVTLKEVAILAGVSRSAVSRTFTEGASVSEKTRAKVEKAARELGYQPNVLARSLTTRRTKLIGLVSDNFRNPLFLQIFDLFTRGLQDLGLRPVLLNLSDAQDPHGSVRMLQQYSVDGVVIASSTLPPAFARAFRDAGVPVVHSFGRPSSAPDIHVVGIDNRFCGWLAAETLIARGYRTIGFMGGPQTATSTQDRLAGFSEATKNHPDVAVRTSFCKAYSFEAGRMEMARLLGGQPAEAYFCGDDVLSIGAISALQSAGLSVPNDVGIIGLNDMEMAGWQNINLTTIRQPVREIIRSSIELMAATLEDPARTPEARLFACHIVERGTLKPL
ncbi:MAG: LacI family DNA-binding transcriptional regulator [Pseudomonadota bacterium]